MSRLVEVTAAQIAKRESGAATAVVEFGPGQPVQFGPGDRVVSDLLKLERPLPLATLVRHVLTRYGLEPASDADCPANAESDPPGSKSALDLLGA